VPAVLTRRYLGLDVAFALWADAVRMIDDFEAVRPPEDADADEPLARRSNPRDEEELDSWRAGFRSWMDDPE